MKKPNIISAAVGIAISLYVIFTSITFPEDHVMKIGPGFFPLLLAILFLIFSIILILKEILSKKSKEEFDKFSFKDPGIIRSLITLGALIVYIILLPYLGFIIDTIILLVFLMLLMKYKKYLIIGVTSVGVSFAVFFIFEKLLNITLPMGFIEIFFNY